ncbi:MAG: hypothetical protein WD904_02860 [Dehalococcoidia bacterium]
MSSQTLSTPRLAAAMAVLAALAYPLGFLAALDDANGTVLLLGFVAMTLVVALLIFAVMPFASAVQACYAGLMLGCLAGVFGGLGACGPNLFELGERSRDQWSEGAPLGYTVGAMLIVGAEGAVLGILSGAMAFVARITTRHFAAPKQSEVG